MRAHHLLFVLPLALPACKNDQPSPPASSTVAATPDSAVATGAPSGTPAAGTGSAAKPVANANKPPTIADWDGTAEVKMPDAAKLGCVVKELRDWVRITCRKNDTGGTPSQVKVDSGGGRNVYTLKRKGMASLAAQVREGQKLQATFSWTDKSHQVTIEWPKGKPMPSPVASFGPEGPALAAPTSSATPATPAALPAGVKWVAFSDKLPANALLASDAAGKKQAVCRGEHAGGVHPGGVVEGKCRIAATGKEVSLDKFEVLVGDAAAITWVDVTGDLPGNAISGGEADGKPLFVCRARHLEGWHAGKLVGNTCLIAYDGAEVKALRYQALVPKS